tara:strand:- start:1830 stop:2816 length:987 start_codon:yes stop_codon:yes gene_type:complete
MFKSFLACSLILGAFSAHSYEELMKCNYELNVAQSNDQSKSIKIDSGELYIGHLYEKLSLRAQITGAVDYTSFRFHPYGPLSEIAQDSNSATTEFEPGAEISMWRDLVHTPHDGFLYRYHITEGKYELQSYINNFEITFSKANLLEKINSSKWFENNPVPDTVPRLKDLESILKVSYPDTLEDKRTRNLYFDHAGVYYKVNAMFNCQHLGRSHSQSDIRNFDLNEADYLEQIRQHEQRSRQRSVKSKCYIEMYEMVGYSFLVDGNNQEVEGTRKNYRETNDEIYDFYWDKYARASSPRRQARLKAKLEQKLNDAFFDSCQKAVHQGLD